MVSMWYLDTTLSRASFVYPWSRRTLSTVGQPSCCDSNSRTVEPTSHTWAFAASSLLPHVFSRNEHVLHPPPPFLSPPRSPPRCPRAAATAAAAAAPAPLARAPPAASPVRGAGPCLPVPPSPRPGHVAHPARPTAASAWGAKPPPPPPMPIAASGAWAVPAAANPPLGKWG